MMDLTLTYLLSNQDISNVSLFLKVISKPSFSNLSAFQLLSTFCVILYYTSLGMCRQFTLH